MEKNITNPKVGLFYDSYHKHHDKPNCVENKERVEQIYHKIIKNR
jgi:hypothetical protein